MLSRNHLALIVSARGLPLCPLRPDVVLSRTNRLIRIANRPRLVRPEARQNDTIAGVMSNSTLALLTVLLSSLALHAQPSSSYVSRTIAGIFPLGNGGPATEALLESPQAVAADLSGTIYIADTGNGAIRRVSGGVISTVERFTGYIYDLKLDAGGDLYVAAGSNIFTSPPPVS